MFFNHLYTGEFANMDQGIKAIYRTWWKSQDPTISDRQWRYRIYQNRAHLDLAREVNRYVIELFSGSFEDFRGQIWDPITLSPR